MENNQKNTTEPKNIFARSFTTLSKSFELLRRSFEENHKRYEDLVHQSRKDHERATRIARFDAYAITIISIVGIGLSIIITSYWNYKEQEVQKKQQEISQLYTQASETQDQINKMFSKRDELMKAMTNLRAIRDRGQKKCVNGNYAGTDTQYQEELFTADYNLVSATYVTEGIFNDSITDKVINFEHLADVDRLSICAPDAPKDPELRLLQREINVAILDSIKILENQKQNIINQAKKAQLK